MNESEYLTMKESEYLINLTMNESEYEVAKSDIKTHLDQKYKYYGITYKYDYCCDDFIDEVIKMIGYIVKAIYKYYKYEKFNPVYTDKQIYSTLIGLIYGLHYLEQSDDILTFNSNDLYIDLSTGDVLYNGNTEMNVSSYVRRFFLHPYHTWDAIYNIVELYLQVNHNDMYRIDEIDRYYVNSASEDSEAARTINKMLVKFRLTKTLNKMDESTGGYKKTRKRSKRKIKKSVKNKWINWLLKSPR
jgi:hypothetical protein